MSYVLCLSKPTFRKGYDGKKVETSPLGKPYGKPGTATCVTKFPTERGAKIALAALNKRKAKRHEDEKKNSYYTRHNAEVYMVMSFDEWTENFNPMVERKNLLSGLPYQERYYTESYMSPACESYHCM